MSKLTYFIHPITGDIMTELEMLCHAQQMYKGNVKPEPIWGLKDSSYLPENYEYEADYIDDYKGGLIEVEMTPHQKKKLKFFPGP